MNKTRKALVAFLAVMTIFIWGGTASTRAYAAEPTTIEVASADEFASALKQANDATGDDEYVIKLAKDIEASGSVTGSCPVTILGGGHTLKLGGGSSIQVAKGSRLALGSRDGSDELTLKGEVCNDEPGMLHVEGSCDMYDGVTLADRQGNNYYGGGVSVEGGTFHMHGGTIENCGIKGGSVCYGGGVGVIAGGTFVMDSGEITGCYADSVLTSGTPTGFGGGVFITNGSSFVMNGGSISNNSASGVGGGVAVVARWDSENKRAVFDSYAELNAGSIDGNAASDGGGVTAIAGDWAVYNGLGATSAGASEHQGLKIGNVSITNNQADTQDGSGGGVLVFVVNAPAVVSIDGATITGNSANEGGGLAAYANDMDTIPVTNAKLCNNTASTKGADVCTSGTKVSLSAASDMGENYLGGPDDVANSRIDGWYLDGDDAHGDGTRYADQAAGDRKAFENYASIGVGDRTALVAASNHQLVKVSFTNEDGSILYGEGWYAIGTKADQIQAPTPTKDSDDTYDYVFDGWDTTISDVTGDATYKAQFKRVFKRFGAKYEFRAADASARLPDEVLALLPKNDAAYAAGDVVSAITPAQTTVAVADGTWTFKGYDRDSAVAGMDTADDAGNVRFVGTWEFTKKTEPAQPGHGGTGAGGSNTGSNATADAGQAASRELPQTSDAFSPAAPLVLLAVSIVTLGAALAFRK